MSGCGLDFDASVAWPIYDWAGVSKAAVSDTVVVPFNDIDAVEVLHGPAHVPVHIAILKPAHEDGVDRRSRDHPELSETRNSARERPVRDAERARHHLAKHRVTTC